MKKTGQFLFLSVILLILSGSVIGCSSSSTASNKVSSTIPSTTSSTITNTISAADAAILTYANPETETTLQGLSEDNLEKYTQYGDSTFKTAVTQQVFDSIVPQISSKYGNYLSKEFQSTGQQQGYIVVFYKAKYTKANVNVEMSFDSNHQVAGQFFVP